MREKIENILRLIRVLCSYFASFVVLFGCSPTPSCGNPNTSMIIKRDFYSFCFNKETKQPFWVLQGANLEEFEESIGEPISEYHLDADIPKKDQASEDDYKNSSWVMSSYLFPFSKQEKELYPQYIHYQNLFSITSPQNPEFHKGY